MKGIVLILVVGLFYASAESAETIKGHPKVTDGDTLVFSDNAKGAWLDAWMKGKKVKQIRIRMEGIDAPESKQWCLTESGKEYPCGKEATEALEEFIGDKEVLCDSQGRGKYGRIIAFCYAGKEDLNQLMVRYGHALAYRKYSKKYVKDEDVARNNKAGMWAGEFQKPWIWRKRDKNASLLEVNRVHLDEHRSRSLTEDKVLTGPAVITKEDEMKCALLKKQFQYIIKSFRFNPKKNRSVVYREAKFAAATGLANDAIKAGCW